MLTLTLVLLSLTCGETWWSFQPLKRPGLPVIPNETWSRHPVDVFIRAKHLAYNLKPSPEADRLTLLRRLSFDLTGLPPTPEEQDAFIRDTRPDAYERLVDRLLASTAYGERWARHWLDIARYADTHGYDKDKRREHAWRYRDWVIDVLNAGKPYRDFVREQLAGDVLAPGRPEGLIATGYIAAGPWDFVGQVELREGTIDKMKTRVLDRDDMVSSTLGAFASLTVGCARCHDHKFDPISQEDYYSLQAVFAGVDRGNRRLPGHDEESDAKERQNLALQLTEVEREIAKVLGPDAARIAALKAQWYKLPLPTQRSTTNGYHSLIEPTPNAVKWVQIDLGTPLMLDGVYLFPARPVDFPDTPGFGFPVRYKVEASDDATFKTATLLLDRTTADVPNPGDVPQTIDAAGAKARYVRITATRLWKRTNDYAFALGEVQVTAGGKVVSHGKTVTSKDTIDAGRWARRHLVDGADSRWKLADATAPAFSTRLKLAKELAALEAKSLAAVPLALRDKRARITKQRDALEAKKQTGPEVYSIISIPPRPIHLLKRGDVEQPKAAMTPRGLSCVELPREFGDKTEGERRLALADWLTHRDHPLTWRSAVNRVWHHHFGRGLVDTPNDFGRMGSLPTHPELLDWLAVEFRDSGGSLKVLHRLLVTSATYRQAGQHNDTAAKVDGDNRYIWRMTRRRLDAEALRDATLAVSGSLDRHAGGSGYTLFRFKDDHSPIYDHSALERIHDPATYRRTVYRFVVRSVPNPFLECLDCADPNQPVPVRNTTLTALQALALMNNPFMVRQSSLMAERLQATKTDLTAQMEIAHRLAFGRPADANTRTALAEHARIYGLAATCRVLLNANEFVFVD